MRGITRFSAGGVFCLAFFLLRPADAAAQSGTIDFNGSNWAALTGQVLYRGGPANTLTDGASYAFIAEGNIYLTDLIRGETVPLPDQGATSQLDWHAAGTGR